MAGRLSSSSPHHTMGRRKLDISASRLQLWALYLLVLLALLTLIAHAWLLSELKNQQTSYIAYGTLRCKDCHVPTWFDPSNSQSEPAKVLYAVLLHRWLQDTNLWWEPNVCAGIAYAVLVLAYLIAALLLRRWAPDVKWIWVRTDMYIMSLLALLGLAPAVWNSILSWDMTKFTTLSAAGELAKYQYDDNPPSLYANAACEAMKTLCAPTRMAIGIIWTVPVLFILVVVAELVYVAHQHGGRMGWRHSVSVLSGMPPASRKKEKAYDFKTTVMNTVERDVELDLVEDQPLMPFKGGTPAPQSVYPGQGDAPPMYTAAQGGAAAMSNATPSASVVDSSDLGAGENLPTFSEASADSGPFPPAVREKGAGARTEGESPATRSICDEYKAQILAGQPGS